MRPRRRRAAAPWGPERWPGPSRAGAATIAGEQLTLAELVPGLGADAHAAAGALHVVYTGHGGAARDHEVVEAGQPLGLDQQADGFAFCIAAKQFVRQFGPAQCDAGAGLVQHGGQSLHLGAGSGQRRLLGLRALQAGVFLGVQTLVFHFGKLDFFLHGLGLGRRGHRVQLGAVAGCLLPMAGSFALQPGAQSVFAAKGVGSRCGLAFGGLQCRLHLGGFSGQGPCGLGKAGALQLDRLQLYEVFNEFMHCAKKFTACTGHSENARGKAGVDSATVCIHRAFSETERFTSDTAPERQSRGILASFLRHFWP
jgi:hypothetical protein